MSDHSDDTDIKALDDAFGLLGSPAQMKRASEAVGRDDREWKASDPESYKKDMEEMCKAMFGDDWEAQYQAMLREEFPEE